MNLLATHLAVEVSGSIVRKPPQNIHQRRAIQILTDGLGILTESGVDLGTMRRWWYGVNVKAWKWEKVTDQRIHETNMRVTIARQFNGIIRDHRWKVIVKY
jgi:hypothetical protein